MGRKPRSKSEQEGTAGIDTEGDTVVDDDSDAEDEADSGVDAEVDPDSAGETTAEINVEDLIAQIESAERKGQSPGNARRKLEDYLEERRTFRDLMDFEDYDLDDD